MFAFAHALHQRAAQLHEDSQPSGSRVEGVNVSKKRKSRNATQKDTNDLESLSTAVIRNASRHAYLQNREKQQLELLRQEVYDEEALFSGMQISQDEQESIARKKRILQIAEERMAIDDGFDGYAIPEESRSKTTLLHNRIKESDSSDWETSQIIKVISASNTVRTQTDYEYVFDESQAIAFVVDSATSLENQGTAKDKLLQARIVEAENRGTF